MDRYLTGFIFMIVMVMHGTAQQTPLLSHYFYNPYLINPAMAGQSKETRAFLFYRQQWVGVPGAPQTQALTVDGPIGDSSFGLGLSINNDVTNVIGRFFAMVSTSQNVKFTSEIKFCLRSVSRLGDSGGRINVKRRV